MKKKPAFKTAALFLAFLMAMSLCSCKQEDEAEETEPETVAAVETEPETEPEEVIPEGMVRSYLTGELVPEEIGTRRAVAVMINNVEAALPSYGLSSADIVFEAPVEAGIVRFMALFEQYDDLEEIGSVRSARTYYAIIQQEFDSIFFHYGQCDYALDYLENSDSVNGVTDAGNWAYHSFAGREAPHDKFTCADEIEYAIDRLEYDKEYSEDYEGHYLFVGDDEEPYMPDAFSADKVSISYVTNSPWFEYSEDDGLYYRFQYGEPHTDGDGVQLSCRNIIIQYCDYEHYYDTDYLNIDVWNGGDGMYITDGKAIDVTWEKDDGDDGVTHYYDLEGNEIELNQGKTWVCIVRNEAPEEVVLE